MQVSMDFKKSYVFTINIMLKVCFNNQECNLDETFVQTTFFSFLNLL